MQLSFETHVADGVAVIRCKGRITFGPETEALEAEIDRSTRIAGTAMYRTRRIVLQMEETDFIDSFGLGVLVRLYSVLQAAGGGLKLCQVSPRVLKVIEITHLGSVFPAYSSEAEAIAGFSRTAQSGGGHENGGAAGIVCVDPSKDVLAELSAFLTRSGYEVMTTHSIREATILANSIKARLVICGPGIPAVPVAAEVLEQIRRHDRSIEILQLPPDFHTAEAGQAAEDLLSRIQSLFGR